MTRKTPDQTKRKPVGRNRTAEPLEYEVTLTIQSPQEWLGQDFGGATFQWGFVKPWELRKLVEHVYEHYGHSDAHMVVQLGGHVVFDGYAPYLLIEYLTGERS